MEQYEKSGPPVKVAVEQKTDHSQDLKELIKAQNSRIDFLERELKRLKARVDDATAMINRRNG